MNIFIQSTLKTLEKSKFLLNKLSNDDYCNSTVLPYNSSIGTHIRHILDFYECIFRANTEGFIDLTLRSRNREVEANRYFAINYLDAIIEKLQEFEFNLIDTVLVLDDLGLGKTKINYNYGALFSQANSHTIHHYAIINYIMEGLNISVKDLDFGYNPTSSRNVIRN